MKTRTQPKPKCTCSDDVFDISPRCKVHAQPTTAAAAPEAPQTHNWHLDADGVEVAKGQGEKPAQHTPLPWHIACDDGETFAILGKGKPTGRVTSAGDITHHDEVAMATGKANAAFIVEACNNYERVKAERDKAWATSNRHLIERNQRIEQVRELLAACKDLVNAADNCLPCKGDGILNESMRKAEAAITNAEKP